jgi:hypothetical protein
MEALQAFVRNAKGSAYPEAFAIRAGARFLGSCAYRKSAM